MTDQQQTDQHDPTRQLKISRPAYAGPATIELDGIDISQSLTAVRLELEPLHSNAVLHVAVRELEHDGRVTVSIPDHTARLLVKLGWTPPLDAGEHGSMAGPTIEQRAEWFHREMTRGIAGAIPFDKLMPAHRADLVRAVARAIGEL